MYRITDIEYLEKKGDMTIIGLVQEKIIKQASLVKTLDYLVRKGGSNLEGTLFSSRSILGVTQMVPIKIAIIPAVFLFPTHSINSNECYWINYCQIKSVKAYQQGSLITFFSNHTLIINIGTRSIQRGIRLCSKYQKETINANFF